MCGDLSIQDLCTSITETGFFGEFAGCYRVFLDKKPGFWLIAGCSETGFFGEFAGCYRVFFEKKLGFCPFPH